MNEIVKYHKDFENKLILKNFTANELNFLMAICTKVRDKNEEEVIFNFTELKKLSNWTNKNDKNFIASLENTNKKLMALNFRFENEKEIIMFVLFPTFYIDKDNKTLKVAVNTKFSYLLNNLSNNFNWYQLKDFTELKSKYSKLLYKELTHFKDTGYRIFKIEDFRKKLDIPEIYKMSHINQKVLRPIEEDLKKVFSNFEIIKVKNGREIAQIRFNFIYKKSELKQSTKDFNEIITSAGELEEYFRLNFSNVNYTLKHKEILEKLLKNNSLAYIKKYLDEQWEYVQNDNKIYNKEAYFSSLILGEKAVYRNYLPEDYEEQKTEERSRSIETINTITTFKDFIKEEPKKQNVTEEEFYKIKKKWCIEYQEKFPNTNLELLESMFKVSEARKYNIVAVKEELSVEEKELKELEENIKKMQEELNRLKGIKKGV